MRQNATHSEKSPRYTGAPSSPSDLLTIDQRSRSKCGRVTQDHPASNFTITRKMQQNATKCNTFRKNRSRIISLCGLHQNSSEVPLSLQIAGLLLLTVLLVIGTLPIALYVSIAGGSVSIPMVFYGLRLNRVHRRAGPVNPPRSSSGTGSYSGEASARTWTIGAMRTSAPWTTRCFRCLWRSTGASGDLSATPAPSMSARPQNKSRPSQPARSTHHVHHQAPEAIRGKHRPGPG